jgi:hypothetical protein
LWSAFIGGGPPLDRAERAALAGYDHIAFVGRTPFAAPSAAALLPVLITPRFALFAVRESSLDAAGAAR